MKCPVCKEVNLVMTDRQGIEIDYCPECRGVWLDRGELDKLIDRSMSRQAPAHHHDVYHDRSQKYEKSDPYYKKKKHESLLGELFDF